MSTNSPSSARSQVADKIPEEIFDADRQPSRFTSRARGPVVGAYILISLGVFFLLASQFPVGGGALLVALALAFLLARVTTGTYGYAVPAGVLLGLGLFVALNDARVLPGNDGGWALVLLGAGFLVIYPLGARARQIWPVIPGAFLLVMGLILLNTIPLASLTSFVWMAHTWPVILVAMGLWILGRDYLPVGARHLARTVFVSVLIAYTALVFAVGLAAGTNAFSAWIASPFGPAVGTASSQVTSLSAPLSANESLQIVNQTGGSVQVVATDETQVQARITRSSLFGSNADVSLTPQLGGLLLQARSAGFWPGLASSVDLVVTVPRSAPVVITTSSGSVRVADQVGAVRVTTSSGEIEASHLGGTLEAQSSSGQIQIADVAGDTRIQTSSGTIDASGLTHLRGAQSSSGEIHLSGTFVDDALVQSSSGEVTIGFTSDSSVRINAATSSGGIDARSLNLADRHPDQRRLTGILGSGTGSLAITTSSGVIMLEQIR